MNKKILDVIGKSLTEDDVEFVNISVSDDTLLFLDPVKIALLNSSKSKVVSSSQAAISSYNLTLGKMLSVSDMSNLHSNCLPFIQHAGECKYIHLGFCSERHSGRGTGEENFANVLSGLLIKKDANVVLESPLGVMPMLTKGFANDRMSDVLGGVLIKSLSEYTGEMIRKYSLCANEREIFLSYWDTTSSSYLDNSIKIYTTIDGFEFLLVPKAFVSGSILNNAGRVVEKFILKRIQEELLNHPESCKIRKLKNGQEKVIPPSRKSLYKLNITDKGIDTKSFVYEYFRSKGCSWEDYLEEEKI